MSEIEARLAAMPKAEIHVHLEGATTAQTYFEIAKRNGAPLECDELPQWQRFFQFTDFDHFIAVYVQSTRVLRTADDYRLMLARFAAQQAAMNVLYTETFVSCSLLPESLDRDAFLDTLAAVQDEILAEHGIVVRCIADISRELPHTRQAVVDLAIEGRRRGAFIGLGLGGPEIGFPPEAYADAYARARAAGLHVVAHAGETVGSASIVGALDALRAERIGHGVRAIEDAALVQRLRDERIALEVCPQSNYRLGVVPQGAPHPIRALMDAGVRVTVNSDDPAMFETSLTNEYVQLAAQGFSFDELVGLSEATLEASFISDADRARIAQRWASSSPKTQR